MLPDRPATRYAETEDGFVAYQVFGEGDRDIFFITEALKNLDVMWDEPSVVRFFDRLARMGRVITYDMRGSGVSDPVPNSDRWLPIERNVDDVRAVLDAVGSERVVVYGTAEGCFSAMMFSAVEPNRVESLVLANPYARLLEAEDYPIGMTRTDADELSDRYVAQHGTTGTMVRRTAPSAFDDPRFMAWWVRYARLSVPVGMVRSTFDWFCTIDIRAALPLIQAPTLVVTRRDAQFHRPEFGRYVADRIEGSRLVELQGADTLPFHAGDFGPVLDAVEEFLIGRPEPVPVERVLATVLFTDIVGSTEMAVEMGDQRWLDLLADHDRIVRTQLARFQGREIKMTGDGCLATFDGPARAVACALAVSDALATIGLTIRAGIHTGEVEYRDGELGGIAVHIASRVMNHAENGGVVVSGTVKDLVVGSGMEFRSCGTVELKGVPGEWALWAPITA